MSRRLLDFEPSREQRAEGTDRHGRWSKVFEDFQSPEQKARYPHMIYGEVKFEVFKKLPEEKQQTSVVFRVI
jgi:hypothetical protein